MHRKVLDEYGKTSLSMNKTYRFGSGHNKFKVLLIVSLGVINIAGQPINDIVMNKTDGAYSYINPISGQEIPEYSEMKPKDFVLKMMEEGKISL